MIKRKLELIFSETVNKIKVRTNFIFNYFGTLLTRL